MNNNYIYSKKIVSFILIIYFSLGSKVFGSELDTLFVHLKNAQNPIVAKEFENQIWKFWINDSSNENYRLRMKKGINLMQEGKLDEALNIFITLSILDPSWAEPLNKIATISYLQGNLYESIINIELTLKLEPRHFGAIAGLAQINFAIGKYQDSLNNLDYAISIYPYIGIRNLRPVLISMIEKSEI